MLGHSNSNNIGDFNGFRFFWDTLYFEKGLLFHTSVHGQDVPQKV